MQLIKSIFRKILQEIIEPLYTFFLAPQSASIIGLFRIGLGSITLLNELSWLGRVRLLFTDDGFFSTQLVQQQSSPFASPLFFWIHSPELIQFLYIILIISTILFTLGIYSRFANLIQYVLLISFHARAPTLHNGPINLICIFSFYMLFMQSDIAYAIRWPSNISKYLNNRTLPGWPLRLMQIQIIIVYFFSSLEKIRVSPQWYNGTSLYYILNFPPYPMAHWSWLINYPIIVNFATWFALGTELMFPYLIWTKKGRPFILTAAVLLHLGIILTLNVDYFSEVMIVSYILFLKKDEVETFISKLF